MYGQIISFLFVMLILYYVVMILIDIQKAKAAKAAELEKNSEEDIDISDEARSFKPVMISRDDPNKVQNGDGQSLETSSEADPLSTDAVSTEKEDKDSESADKTQGQKSETYGQAQSDSSKEELPHKDSKKISEEPTQSSVPEEKPFRREGYREPLMTDGLEVGRFIEEAEILVETGQGPLGGIVYEVLNP